MRNSILKMAVFLTGALALVVSVDIAPDAAETLLRRGEGETNFRIENLRYCVGNRSFARLSRGRPEAVENYDLVEVGELNIYVPRSMSFEGDVPNIVTFARRTGPRGVGVSNPLN